MLFKQHFMDLIASGKLHSAFRKWTRPSVLAQGTLLTPAGQLRIISLEKIDYGEISDSDILQAGYASREELDHELAIKTTGDIYRIDFKLEQADPRIALRENTTISQDEMQEILETLRRFDSRGSVKNWTFGVLDLLEREPGKFAVEYSASLGYKKDWLKLNIRKLKNLGLTISLSDGYMISPRGKVILTAIRRGKLKGR